MKFDQYVTLIQRLEKFAAERRGAYHFRILLLTILGYAYFVGLIVLFVLPLPLVGILIFLAPEAMLRILFYTVKLWWAVIPGLGLYFGFIGSAIRSITARVPDPPGRDLLPGEAPRLYEFVENTCDTLKAARPARIIVSDEFNAAVATMPRFGIFGRKILLIIGLPLMKALSPEQLKAALAHEIGHISGRHGVFTKWAYQMREAWGRLIDSQEAADHKFAWLYRGFVNWFFPYFTAYSFVLMREHEKDADRDAVRLTTVESLGEALILLETKGRHIDEVFWREIHEENLAKETPSEELFSRMLESLNKVDSERASVALSKAMSVPTDFSDSHPSLADRLRLIGYPLKDGLPRQPETVTADAAAYFLKDGGRSLSAEYDRAWDEQAAKEWKNRHLHFQESQKRIVELNARTSTEELSRDELLELAERQAEREGIAASLPTMLKAAERFPDDPVVLYNIGGVRLSLDDEQGLKDLERAAELDRSFKLAASDVAFSYLRGKGRLDEARSHAAVIDEQNELLEKAQKERQSVMVGDQFERHQLPDEFLERIPGKLAGFDEIIAIYAVKKSVKYLPEHPFHVLFLALRKKGRFKNSSDLDPQKLIELVADRLNSGEIQFFATLTGDRAGIQEYLDKIPGAKIWTIQ